MSQLSNLSEITSIAKKTLDGQKVLTNSSFLTESNSESLRRVNNRHGFYFRQKETNGKAQSNKPNLIDEIVFIADKGRTWNKYLQVSIISVTEEDFKL